MPKITKVTHERQVKFALRIPEPLHVKLQKSADRSRRSLNSEILTLLEKALTLDETK